MIDRLVKECAANLCPGIDDYIIDNLLDKFTISASKDIRITDRDIIQKSWTVDRSIAAMQHHGFRATLERSHNDAVVICISY